MSPLFEIDLGYAQTPAPTEVSNGWHTVTLESGDLNEAPESGKGPRFELKVRLDAKDPDAPNRLLNNKIYLPIPQEYHKEELVGDMRTKDKTPLTKYGMYVDWLKKMLSVLGGPESGSIKLTPTTFTKFAGKKFDVKIKNELDDYGDKWPAPDFAFGRGV